MRNIKVEVLQPHTDFPEQKERAVGDVYETPEQFAQAGRIAGMMKFVVDADPVEKEQPVQKAQPVQEETPNPSEVETPVAEDVQEVDEPSQAEFEIEE